MSWFDNTEERPAPVGLGQYTAEKLAELGHGINLTGKALPPALQTNGTANGSVFDQLDQHADWYDDILGPKVGQKLNPPY